MKDKISVIIPTRNRTNKLSRAVLSVISQCNSSFDLEVIVVDDNDLNCISEINNYLSDEIRLDCVTKEFIFQVVRNPNLHSAANARNYGVSISSGNYLTFLDDDDIFLPGRLKEMHDMIRNQEYDFLSTYRFFENNNIKSITIPRYQLQGDISLEQIYLNNDIDIGIFLSKELFVNIGMFDSKMRALEDWDLIIRLLSSNKKCYKLPNYLYLVNNDQGVSRVTDNEVDAYLYISNKYRKILGEKWFFKIISKYYSMINTYSMVMAFEHTYRSQSFYPLKIYIKSIIKKLNKH